MPTDGQQQGGGSQSGEEKDHITAEDLKRAHEANKKLEEERSDWKPKPQGS